MRKPPVSQEKSFVISISESRHIEGELLYARDALESPGVVIKCVRQPCVQNRKSLENDQIIATVSRSGLGDDDLERSDEADRSKCHGSVG